MHTSYHTRPRVTVQCSDCGKTWEKPKVKLKDWGGRCRACAMALNRLARRFPISEETRKKLSAASTGRTFPNRKPVSDDTRAKLSAASKGRKLGPQSPELKAKLGAIRKGRPSWNKGRTLSESHKQKLSEAKQRIRAAVRGDVGFEWQGYITPDRERIRKCLEYRQWRAAVFQRDDYTCQRCEKRGGYLQADHIKLFADYPELWFDVSNGQTLCLCCHRQKTSEDMKARVAASKG